MSTFYEDMAATASELLTEFGMTIAVRSIVGGVSDPVDGSVSEPVVTDTSVKGVRINMPSNLIDGTRITSRDRLWVIEGSVDPVTSNQLLVASVAYPIEEVRPVNPAGTQIVSFVRIRV